MPSLITGAITIPITIRVVFPFTFAATIRVATTLTSM
jgi:hypothetical protein